MFMPAGAYDPTPPFTLDSIQLLRISLMDPFTRCALVLIILVPVVGATLVVITKRNATVREEQRQVDLASDH